MEVQIKRNQLLATYIAILVLSLILGLSLYPYSQLNQEKIVITPFEIEEPRQAQANIAAVMSEASTGTIGKTFVLIENGEGKVLIETNPFIEPDTQFSANTAKEVAEKYVELSLKDYNVVYSYSIQAQVLGGPSAGAAMAVATIAAMKNKNIKEGVVVTGTINSDGTIGSVGGILEKAKAAGENNMKLFLVPLGQSKLTYYERVIEKRGLGSFVIQDVRYVPKTLNLNNYTMQEYGMQVKEVKNINEVASHMLK